VRTYGNGRPGRYPGGHFQRSEEFTEFVAIISYVEAPTVEQIEEGLGVICAEIDACLSHDLDRFRLDCVLWELSD
jgi:hypothetical protein